MRRGWIVLGFLVLGAFARGAAAEDPWGSDEVARVGARSVTWEDLCVAAADAALPRLQDEGGLDHWAFMALVGDRVLAPLCGKHGVLVTEDDVDASWKTEDEQARARTGVGLGDGLRSRNRPAWSKRDEIRRRLRIRRLEAKGVDVQAAFETATIKTRVPVKAPMEVAALPEGLVATVDGVPISYVALGSTVLAYGGARQARELVERACRIALAEAEGVRLDPAAMEPELARHARLAPMEAMFDAEEVWEQLRVRGGVEHRERHTAAWVRTSPYAQSLFGLVKRSRESASAAEVEAVWAREKDTTFGPHVLVVDVEVPFRSRGDLFGTGPDRSRLEALRLARSLGAELSRGTTLEALAERCREADLPGVVVARRRLYRTQRSRILLEPALRIADGAVTKPVETLSEVHVLRRERVVPAPPFEAIEPVVRERLARHRTRLWLEQKIADRELVRVRWPLPQLR